MLRRIILFILSICSIAQSTVVAQQELDERALIEVKDGISISKDSLFLLNLRFRMQNRIGYTSVVGEDWDAGVVDARVRRLRLRLDGYVLNRDLRYYIQLNFSRADLDLDGGTVAQPVRDAMVYYHFNKYFYVGMGQSKLPGNRQRVTSSGNQQFPDRSIANGVYTLDRDYGVFAYWTLPLRMRQQFQLKGAISTGDGRGASPGNTGLAYTGRLEWLPLGVFTDKGDYSEGDLEFEPHPKLSLAAGYSHNEGAYRTGGQLGSELYSSRTMGTFIADALLKYNGWAVLGEFFDRQCDEPITMNDQGAVRFVRTGQGVNTQLSKVLQSHYEFALRYSLVNPGDDTAELSDRMEEVLLGSTKYLNGHRIKLQFYTGYRWFERRMELDRAGNSWTAMFQVEFGI